jgi:nucleoid-associated protein YgaU
MKGGPAIRIAILLIASLAVVGILIFAWPTAEPERPAPIASSKAPPASSKTTTAPAPVKEAVEALKSLTDQVAPPSGRNDGPPAFDVARIEPNGEAVIGGRAAPGATVELLRGGVVHARTEADPSGEFVLVPKPLPPGSYDLTLRATQKDGKVATSKDSVAVMLRHGGEEKPVVALATPDKPSVVLSNPNADPALKLAIDAVEGEAGGRMYVSGRAESGAKVNLYLNDAYIASATASKEGRIAFSIRSGIKPGDYRVRLDQVDASGRVQNRAEVPFNAPAALAGPAPSETSGPQSTAAASKMASASTSSDPTSAPPPAVAPAPQPGLSEQPKPSELPKPSESAPRVTSAAPTTAPEPPAPQTSATQASPEPAAPQTKTAPREEASTPAGAPPSSSPAPSETAASSQSGPTDMQLATAAPSKENGKDKDASAVVVPHVDTTVVVRGDSLWRISRSTYGHGIRYSVIYNANREQIRDPDLIYPGQIFVLPKAQQ